MKIATGLLCLTLSLLTLFLPQQNTEQTVALIFRNPERIEMIAETQARAALAALSTKEALNEAERARHVALTLALGTLPDPPKCITWQQHVAEVNSWWAAPERVYVPCSDPRVGPPKENVSR